MKRKEIEFNAEALGAVWSPLPRMWWWPEEADAAHAQAQLVPVDQTAAT